MGLNDISSGERLHIGFFGARNAGKSSLVNAVTSQEVSLVSDVKGTTTDPVKKAMELLPIGPVVITDTPGTDDEGELGELRVRRTKQILSQVHIAVIVADASLNDPDTELAALFEKRHIPYIIAYSKADLAAHRKELKPNEIYVSAKTGENIHELKEMLGKLAKDTGNTRMIVSDLLDAGDNVVLVIPIDESAPKGRLILPQQLTIREILDAHCTVTACQPEELSAVFDTLSVKPKLVITDSQAFERVSRDTPNDVMLTSFSILFARYKGDLETLVRGAVRLGDLRDGDRLLICEGCTHHRQCNDIGSVKLPQWIESFSGAKPEYTFTSGGTFPEKLDGYKLIVHCGGCMLNEKEMMSRIQTANAAGVPIVNYGTAIAHMNGILKRSLEPFPHIYNKLEKQ